METKIIYEGSDCSVKAVFVNGKFLYTVTYFYDEEGCVKNMIRVFHDGTVDEQ